MTLTSEKKNLELTIEEIPVKGYEKVLKFKDSKSGLLAIIAMHDLTLGPGLGGIRIYPYSEFDLALTDALRLAKGMTYKSAMSGVGFGGAKSVIIADPKKQKTPELLRSMAKAVHSLNGKYICAEDVGCTTEDLKIINEETPYVVGLANEKSSGDPSRFTAWGTFKGIQAVLKKLFGSDSLSGKKIALQGLGSVGEALLDLLFWHGAKVYVSDVDEKKVKKAVLRCGATACPVNDIYSADCDIFSPCAMGGVINDKTLKVLKAKGIAGCANNQLLEERHGDILKERRIIYAPDYVINAGGLINVSYELTERGYSSSLSRAKVDEIYSTLLSIFEIAEKNKTSTSRAANTLAEYKMSYGIGKRTEGPFFPTI